MASRGMVVPVWWDLAIFDAVDGLYKSATPYCELGRSGTCRPAFDESGSTCGAIAGCRSREDRAESVARTTLKRQRTAIPPTAAAAPAAASASCPRGRAVARPPRAVRASSPVGLSRD